MKKILFIVLFFITNIFANNHHIFEQVNYNVNHTIKMKTDKTIYGLEDYWAKPSEILKNKAGDCEDLAILKRHYLIKKGINKDNLHIVLGYHLNEYHAVLVYKTNKTFKILDLYSDKIFNSWSEAIFTPTGTVFSKDLESYIIKKNNYFKNKVN